MRRLSGKHETAYKVHVWRDGHTADCLPIDGNVLALRTTHLEINCTVDARWTHEGRQVIVIRLAGIKRHMPMMPETTEAKGAKFVYGKTDNETITRICTSFSEIALLENNQ